MFWGILVGLLIGMFLTIMIAQILDESKIACITIIITLIMSMLIGADIGIYLDRIDYEKQINTYIVIKQTIKDAMQNENISNLEKIELLKQVNEQNQKLEELKVEVKQWYSFYLDKTKIENLEPIKLK